MAIRPVLRMGHPDLRRTSRNLKPEEIGTTAFKQLVKDMEETMEHHKGIGIAAPQIGQNVRLSVIEFSEDSARYPNMGGLKRTVFVNPKVQIVKPDSQTFWEGCLSVPGLRGLVERPSHVKVDYLNERGEPQHLEAEGFLATVLQHEFDHLDGVLYVDRLKTPQDLAFIEEFQQFILPKTPPRRPVRLTRGPFWPAPLSLVVA